MFEESKVDNLLCILSVRKKRVWNVKCRVRRRVRKRDEKADLLLNLNVERELFESLKV
jgi:hypothetical protein